MNSKINQDSQNPALLQGIQNEVSEENAPLLRFITRYAGIIAACVIALLLILGGWAAWNWHQGVKLKEAREELARINMELKGAERDEALARLAEKAPGSIKLFVYMSLGKSAQENGNAALAAQAFANAAGEDAEGALGMAAALARANSLLTQGEFASAQSLLQDIDAKMSAASRFPMLKPLLAEAALKAGNLELARKTYQELADDSTNSDSPYYRARAADMEDRLSKGKAEGKTSSPTEQNTK